MKKILISTLASLVCAASLSASGYRIPEQSFASVAKSGADIAATYGADASYSNPANMAFMKDKHHFELALTYINLPKVKYTDTQKQTFDGGSTVEHFLVPTTHYVSPKYNDVLTFGLSIAAPSGASKRWKSPYAQLSAKEFSIEVIELNPTVAYKINDQLAVALGARMTYTKGVVEGDGVGLGIPLKRELTGDSIDFGYNLALTYKPIRDLTLAATYRSNIDLTVKGDAVLSGAYPPFMTAESYDGGAGVTIPLPAVLNLAVSYDFGRTTVEAVYERTFWSKYKELDFFYDKSFAPNSALHVFDVKLDKNWKDVNCYRLGITHELNDEWTLMGGFAYDKSPVPEDTLGFEMPGSDAKIYSLGASYKINDNMKVSLGYLYDKKDKRIVKQQKTLKHPLAIHGKFENSSAHLLTAGFHYEF